MSNETEERLAPAIEDPIEPELPICDPHHHLMAGHYLLKELFQDIGGGHNIVETVCVETESVKRKEEQQPVAETKFVHRITQQKETAPYGKTKVAAGIVGFADFTLGNAVAPVLQAHIAASNRLRGIRYITTYDEQNTALPFPTPDSPPRSISTSAPHLLADAKFREGIACLRDFGLSFDACVYHTQLMELVDMAKAMPDIPIILDHIGSPLRIGFYARRRQKVLREWKDGIAALATCPNVSVKLGGLGLPYSGFGWHERKSPPDSTEVAEAMAPFYLWCIEKFGADRCMFESNFPPDKMSYSYTVIWNAFKRITRGFSKQERAALFHDTAARVYRL